MQRLLEKPGYGLNSVEQKAALLVFGVGNVRQYRARGLSQG
jgi:hypothetical protein